MKYQSFELSTMQFVGMMHTNRAVAEVHVDRLNTPNAPGVYMVCAIPEDPKALPDDETLAVPQRVDGEHWDGEPDLVGRAHNWCLEKCEAVVLRLLAEINELDKDNTRLSNEVDAMQDMHNAEPFLLAQAANIVFTAYSRPADTFLNDSEWAHWQHQQVTRAHGLIRQARLKSPDESIVPVPRWLAQKSVDAMASMEWSIADQMRAVLLGHPAPCQHDRQKYDVATDTYTCVDCPAKGPFKSRDEGVGFRFDVAMTEGDPACDEDPIIGVLRSNLNEGVEPKFSGGDLKHLIALLEKGSAAMTALTEKSQAAPVCHEFPVDGWGIDTTAGRPILVYRGCSVIEAEDAYYVLGLIERGHRADVRTSFVPEPVCEVMDEKCNRVRFFRRTGDTTKPYHAPGEKLYDQACIDQLLALKGDPVGSFDKHMEYMQENVRLQLELSKGRTVNPLEVLYAVREATKSLSADAEVGGVKWCRYVAERLSIKNTGSTSNEQ